MTNISSEETTVVATYVNRHDAEVAKSFLEDQGISSFVVADDVHPPIQFTEGVRLFVMSGEAEDARAALEAAHMVGDRPRAEGVHPDEPAETGVGKAARTTSWFYIAGFVLLVIAIIAGLVL